MDLHAILNASDDSSSDEVHEPSSYRFQEGASGGSLPIDIEQILREDDLDDDEDDNDDIDMDDEVDVTSRIDRADGVSPLKHQPNLSWKPRTYNSNDFTDPYSESLDKIDVYTSPAHQQHTASSSNRGTNTGHKSYNIKFSRNAEDWAVLQAILDEDNDEDDSEWLDSTNVVAHTNYRYLENKSVLSSHTSIMSDDVEDIKVDDGDSDSFGLGVELIPPLAVANAHKSTLSPDSTIVSEVAMTRKPQESSSPPQQGKHAAISDGNTNTDMNSSSVLVSRFNTISTGGLASPPPGSGLTESAMEEMADRIGDETSQRAMSWAQAYERKLLRSGQHEIVSPLMVKRRLKPKFEMRPRGASSTQVSRNGFDKSNLSTASWLYQPSLPRFGSSGLIENVAMAGVSESLEKHAASGAKVPCGLPTSLAFNSKFIAVGTQLGIILVFDLFEVLRQRLGVPTPEHGSISKKAGSITSLDLSYNGEAVAAGYASGLLVLWDTIRGVILRAVNDAHPSPISAVRFLNDLKMVTVDAGGLVNKLTFTKNILWSNYSMDTECLLDGTAGQILAMNVLSQFATVKQSIRPDPLAQALRRLTLIALSSERSSFVVSVEPRVHVLHRWARPPTDRTNPLSFDHLGLAESVSSSNTSEQVYLPCLSWGWGLVAGGGNMAMPILARAWSCCVQLLVASFPTWEQDVSTAIAARGEEPPISWPAFGEHKEIDASAPVVALEWLNERSLVYLTITNEFIMVDTVMMVLLERLDFSGLKLVYAEFSLSRNAASAVDSIDGIGSETGICATFQNSIRCSDDRLAVLCRNEIRCLSIVTARRRISALEEDGEWLEALALALDHYESTVVSQEDRKRDQTGRRDLSRHPEFSVVKSEEEEWIAKLLIRYLNLAVENAPEPATEYFKNSAMDMSQTRIDLAQSHFQMLAGVCVEFCVIIRRLDLLYGSIFRRFQSAGYTSVFLDVLEPYVLSDKLSYIAPEAMAYFIEHCKARNGIATVERCLLHMDCTIMDFDSIIALLRANEMYTALIFVFNRGLDDYVTPFEIILERVFDEADAGGNAAKRRRDGVPQTDFERLGYKAVFFLQASFSGKTFPQESELKPEHRQRTVKIEMLRFLMNTKFSPSPHVKKATNFSPLVGQRTHEFPYMRIMLQVDAKAVLDTIAIALDSTDSLLVNQRSTDSTDGWVDETTSKASSSVRMPSHQEVVDVLSTLVFPRTDDQTTNPGKALMHFRNTGNAYLDFAAKYVTQGVVRLDQRTTHLIVNRICNRYNASNDPFDRKSAQRQVMDLLSSSPRESYSPEKVLDLINKSGMHRAALQLHQQVASSWHEAGLDDIELRSRHFQSAIDCFIGDEDTLFRKEVFAYIKKECSGVVENTNAAGHLHPRTLRDSLFSKLAALVHLDALKTARLVAELLVDEMDQVVSSLESNDGGEGQFLFLHAVISGSLIQADPVAGSVLNPTMDHHYKYLTLMARLHPEMVYDYFSTHDNYHPEECLKLCQDHDIADASAYILERMGNVSSALQLILQTLESRMMNLKRTIRSIGVDYKEHSLRHIADRPSFEKACSSSGPNKHERHIEGVKRILIVALDLCERNSGSFATRSEHGSQLWFNVLDRLINAKGFLRLSKEQPEHAKTMEGVLSSLLRLTMQRMVSSVPLPDLVRKVTSDHSGSRLGELREMVESLLDTYGFELTVFQNAVSIFHRDVRNMRKWQHRLQVEGSPVDSLAENAANTTRSGRYSSLQETVVKVGENRSASLVDGARVPYVRHTESGFAHIRQRLRTRRVGSRDAPGRNALGLNLMTVTELKFINNVTDPVVDGPYLAGSLGEAQHRGRLMTFG